MSYNYVNKNEESDFISKQNNNNIKSKQQNNMVDQPASNERVTEDDAINMIANKLNEQSLINRSLGDLSKLYVGKLNNGSLNSLKFTTMKKPTVQPPVVALNTQNSYYQIKQFEQDVIPITPAQVQGIVAASAAATSATSAPADTATSNNNTLDQAQEGYAQDHPGFYVRYAVNGLSKIEQSGSGVPMNRNINRGDFGDDSGLITENSKCIVIGNFLG